ncbi:purine nucleoside phosphorylase-like [Paramacrobiotus metropolitanus]|uniref:purine nucleoside phosphorylase-like n=1 Tax=Paramacrobiotus metropolitanus TaxID=2943436 RepID=UPI0024457684|nr:purine nucleoside phosphorylase-like [Paramacrobiotus metropolitanus]
MAQKMEDLSPDSFKDIFEEYETIANSLREKTRHRPRIAIICGSGLGGLGDLIEERDVVEYENIPYFPVSTVPGHVGRLIFGKLSGVAVVCMQGRFHFYEGWKMREVTMPVRVFKLLGVHTLIVTNAAGSVNPSYKVGDLMIIKDHINFPGLSGNNALMGPNDERWGARFQPLNTAYDTKLRKVVKEIASNIGLRDHTHQGVYAMLSGPTFETPAEARAMRVLGADCCGMSTAPETIVARHCGLRVLGISLITNLIVVEDDTEFGPNHEEVLQVGKRRAAHLQQLVGEVVTWIQQEEQTEPQRSPEVAAVLVNHAPPKSCPHSIP